MRARPPLSEEARREGFAYVDAVLASAAGQGRGEAGDDPAKRAKRLPLGRLVPGFVKRAYVRAAIYLLRHPFDHLAHPVQIRLEEEIGQARGVAQAALVRAEHLSNELRRLRAELDRERRAG